MSPFPSRAFGSVLIVALSGFLVGFDGSLFTGAVIFVERQFALTGLETGWAVTSHTLAATVSIFLAGPASDRLGRRTVLRVAAVVFTASAVVAAFATSFSTLIAARLLSGLGVGAVLVAAPMYIAEIAPPALRGRMVSFNQLFIVLGISAAFFSNYFILQMGAGQGQWPGNWPGTLNLEAWSWRWMLGVGALPAVVYLFVLWAVPESPRWLAMHGQQDAARRILARAHGDSFAAAELAEIRASIGRDAGSSNAAQPRRP